MSGLSAESSVTAAMQRLDDLLRPLDSSDSPGVVIGVRYGGKTTCRKGLGLASIEHGVANTPATRMRIGSTTKHFTCFAALLLAEEGRLNLDAGVRTYLPEIPRLDGEASLRQLMSHTGGYRCYIDLSFLSHGMAVREKGFALATHARQTEANSPPGERSIYCNSGYQILSTIIERVSGTSLASFLRERIFAPNGMHDTELLVSDLEIHPGLATLHVRLPDGGFRRGIFPSEELGGDGGMVSTIDDMLRWLRHLRGSAEIGKRSAWSQMLPCPLLANGTRIRYGLGLQVTPYRGLQTIHHAGAVIGGACQMLTVPAHDLDIVVLSNGASVGPTKLAQGIIDAVLGEELLGPATPYAKTDEHKHLVGRQYRAVSGPVIGFADIEGKLGLELFGNEPVPLRLEAGALRLEFEDTATGPWEVRLAQSHAVAGPPAVLEVAECGNLQAMELVSATPSVQVAASELAGCYYCADLAAHAHFVREGEQLHLRLQCEGGSNVFVLKPIAGDLFALKALDALNPCKGMLVVDRIAGKVAGFRIDTLRTRHLRFTLEDTLSAKEPS